ncbi:hypothetical protein Tco_1279202 [Tanacetum coccineum]
MASGGNDRDAEEALSKLLQMGMMAEYESKFLILANRVTWIFENLVKSFYISGLKPTLQCALLRSNLTTLGEAFSLARATEARFAEDALSKLLQMGTVAKYQNKFEVLIKRVTGISEFLLKSFYISGVKPTLQIELLRARPTTLVEAFSLARMTEAHFEDERTTTTIVEITSDNDARDQASEVEMKVLVDGVGVNEINKWVDKEVQYSVSTLHVLIPLLKHLNDKHIKKKKMKAEEIQRRIWNPGIKINFLDITLRTRWFEGVESVTPVLHEDGRAERPKREKSKPVWHTDYVI